MSSVFRDFYTRLGANFVGICVLYPFGYIFLYSDNLNPHTLRIIHSVICTSTEFTQIAYQISAAIHHVPVSVKHTGACVAVGQHTHLVGTSEDIVIMPLLLGVPFQRLLLGKTRQNKHKPYMRISLFQPQHRFLCEHIKPQRTACAKEHHPTLDKLHDGSFKVCGKLSAVLWELSVSAETGYF